MHRKLARGSFVESNVTAKDTAVPETSEVFCEEIEEILCEDFDEL
jgi:hypothetical protein